MFPFQNHRKKYACTSNFLFYCILCVCALCSTNCGFWKRSLVPTSARLLAELDDEQKKSYKELYDLLEEPQKNKINHQVQQRPDKDDLVIFITQMLTLQKRYHSYRQIFLTKDANKLQKEVKAVTDYTRMDQLINHYYRENKVYVDNFDACDEETKSNYRALLKSMVAEEADRCKAEMMECQELETFKQRVEAKLPASLKQLSTTQKQQISNLPDEQRSNLLKAMKEKDDAEIGSEVPTSSEGDDTPSNPKDPNDAVAVLVTPTISTNRNPTAPSSAAGLSIDQLIKDNLAEATKKQEDGWGSKLTLEGEDRKLFLADIALVDPNLMGALKKLFAIADDNSVHNFSEAYKSGKLHPRERVGLLVTLGKIYHEHPSIGLKICNNPSSIGSWDKMNIYTSVGSEGTGLLTKLQNTINSM